MNVTTDPSPPPKIAVIIAAGRGSRLHSHLGPPKPLLPVAGRPLIMRVLDRFAQAGIDEAVIVVGHRGDEVRAGVEGATPPLPLSFVDNDRWRLSNGLSVLASREVVEDRPFFISMADHIFDTSLITGLATAPLPADGLVLAVDRKLDAIYDMDDATKVRTAADRIVAIGKELGDFDAVDTGLFACTTALFDAIETAGSFRPDGDCSLSDGVTALIAGERAFVHDIGDGRWQDVDTPGAADHAASIFS